MNDQFNTALAVCIVIGCLNETRKRSIKELPTTVDNDHIGAISFGHLKNNPVILYRGPDRFIQVKGKIFHLNTRKQIEEKTFLETLLDIAINECEEEIALSMDEKVIIVDISDGRVYIEAVQ